ncbi:MAG: aminoglycoside phosphotransferase family protein, partial [Candidatus Promineifilaceae bacterium]
MEISESFARRIKGAFGVEGENWLASLPGALRQIQNTWSITLHSPFEDIGYNYVAPVTCADGGEAVLKVGVPNPELYTEIEALRSFAGRGMVRLLKADRDAGAMLLERLQPGLSLFELANDEWATAAAVQVMGQLIHEPSSTGAFPTVADWGRGLERLRAHFGGGTGPFPRRLVERAESDLQELLSSGAAPTLLHGDLHHWNILSAQRAPWLAVDPKGLLGEPEYETGAWLRNPVPHLLRWDKPVEAVKRRLDQFAAGLGYDRRQARHSRARLSLSGGVDSVGW